MSGKSKIVDAYIAKSADFAKPILVHLRELVHKTCPMAEERIAWGSPFFVYKGFLCYMAAFKAHCSFGFWKRKLLFPNDKEGVARGDFGHIKSLSDLPSDAKLIEILKRAIALNENQIKVKRAERVKGPKTLDAPDYFLTALKKNKKALATFEKFSYSHKKEYVEWIVEARRDETRQRRIATALAQMSTGKSRNWKYQNC